MFDLPLTRWAARTVIGVYAIGFASAVVIMVMLTVQRVKEWVKEKGGW